MRISGWSSDVCSSDLVAIRTSDSHSLFDRESGQRINQGRPVIIQEHSWISRRASLNKGTRIGADVVLGQESVASGVLKSRCVYSGNPARLVHENTTWDRTQASTLRSEEHTSELQSLMRISYA